MKRKRINSLFSFDICVFNLKGTYRGPTGAWTRRTLPGKDIPVTNEKRLSEAYPTYAHYAL